MAARIKVLDKLWTEAHYLYNQSASSVCTKAQRKGEHPMKSTLPMDRLGRTRPLALAAAVAAMMAACGGTPAPASSPGNEANAGTVAFLSSQAQPVNEAEGMRRDVLAAFNGTANFDSSRSDAQI